MTAHEAALAAIEARRVLIAAATPGWEIRPGVDRFGTDELVGEGNLSIAHIFRQNDSQLVVAAVNAYARDTDALEAVLLRHEPEWTRHKRKRDRLLICSDCQEAWEYRDPAWPCPDARAALTALGVDHE